MPIDSSIYGLMRPQATLPGPLEQYGQVMALQNAAGQQRLQDLQLRTGERNFAADEKLRNLFATNPTPDVGSVMAIDPTRGMAFAKNQLEAQKTRAELDKLKLEATDKSLKIHRDQLTNVNDPQSAAQWVMAGFNDPLLSPILQRAGSPQQIIAQIPQDPEGFARWKRQNGLDISKFIELSMPKLGQTDLGGKVEDTARDPWTGTTTVTGTSTKTPTIGELETQRHNPIMEAQGAGNLALARSRAAYEGIPVGGGAPAVAPVITPAAVPGRPVPISTLLAPKPAAAASIPADLANLPPKERDKILAERAATKPKDLTSLESMLSETDKTLDLVKAIKNHPGLSLATGATYLTGSIPGTGRAYDAAQLISGLKSQIMLSQLQAFRAASANGSSGFGQLSNAEGDTLRAAITNLERAQGTSQFKAALDTVAATMEGIKERMKNGYARLYGEQPNVKEYHTNALTNAIPPTQDEIDAELRRRGVIK